MMIHPRAVCSVIVLYPMREGKPVGTWGPKRIIANAQVNQIRSISDR